MFLVTYIFWSCFLIYDCHERGRRTALTDEQLFLRTMSASAVGIGMWAVSKALVTVLLAGLTSAETAHTLEPLSEGIGVAIGLVAQHRAGHRLVPHRTE